MLSSIIKVNDVYGTEKVTDSKAPNSPPWPKIVEQADCTSMYEPTP